MSWAPWSRSIDVRLLFGAAALLLIAWSFVIPVFEAPDEHLHWQYARYLHDHWRLPIYGPMFAEANSPPLYYALIAPLAERTATPPAVAWMNGRDELVVPFNPRLFLTAEDDFDRYWPIRRARLLSVLMSLATLAFCARAAFEVTGRTSTTLLAAGFAVLLPQFAFRGSHVSNDVLVTTMAAWLTWLMVRMVREGFAWRTGVQAAIALAAAYLSKINAIALAPPLALVILTDPVPGRDRLKHLGVFAVALGIVAPWTVRNIVLYGDPFASHAMYEAVSGMIYERSPWDPEFVTVLPRELFKSFLGFFGYLSVKLPKWVYAGYLAFFVFAIAGLVRRALQDRRFVRLALILMSIVVCMYAVVVRINMQFAQPQGRYMFPALPAIMLALALGLEGWRPWSHDSLSRGSLPRETLWPARFTLVGWGIAHLLVLWLVVTPAYYPPLLPTISEALTLVRPQPERDVSALADAPGTWTITGPQPTLAADVRVATSDALFVIVDLEGHTSHASTDVSGAFVFTVEPGAALVRGLSAGTPLPTSADAREVRLPFEWRVDGKARRLHLTLLKNPAWSGVVTHVRFVPIDQAASADALRGASVAIRNLRLAGSIPSHDF